MKTSGLNLKKYDDELQIVYGEVYAPNIPDSQGDFMTPEEVRKMAHRFVAKGIPQNIDRQHDNNLTGSVVVESFVARSDDPDYIPESWVVGIHIPDRELWDQVKTGELNGFSFEGKVVKEQTTVALEIPSQIEGATEMNDGHSHVFIVKLDKDGKFIGGQTMEDNSGHTHKITRTTITDGPEGVSGGHTHRFSFTDGLTNDY